MIEVQVDILPACRAAFPGRSFDDLTDEEIGEAIAQALVRIGSPIDIDRAQVGRECRENAYRIPRADEWCDCCNPKGSA